MATTRMREGDQRVARKTSIGGQEAFVPLVELADSANGTAVAATSGNVANASAAASLAAASGVTNYLTGVTIAYTGATAAAVVSATITGLLGGTMTIPVAVPAGVTAGATPIHLDFSVPHPASAANTAITVTLPALGAGNTNAAVYIRGVQK